MIKLLTVILLTAVPTSYQQNVNLAKKEKKHLFVFFTEDWCVWCQKMKSEVLDEKEVSDFMKKNYIIYYTKDKTLKQKLQMQDSIPSYAIVDPMNEEVLNRGQGYKNKNSFFKWQNSTWKQPIRPLKVFFKKIGDI